MYNIDWAHRRMFRKGEIAESAEITGIFAILENPSNANLSTFCTMFLPNGGGRFEGRHTSTVSYVQHRLGKGGCSEKAESAEGAEIFRHFVGESLGRPGAFLTLICSRFVPCSSLRRR